MDDTESAPDQTIPEDSEPNEDKPEESGFTNQVIEEEDAPAPSITAVIEEEEEGPVAPAQETEETPIKEEEEPPIPYQEAEETPVKEEEEPVAPAQETEETPVIEEQEEPPPLTQETEETPVKEEEEEPLPLTQEKEETPLKEEEPQPLTQEKEETPLKEPEQEYPIPSQVVDMSDTALVRSATSKQPADASLVKEASARKSNVKVRERTNSSMQTSLVWEYKPLAEVLQSKPVPNQVSGVSEKAVKEEAAPGNAETEQHIVQEYFHSAEAFGEEPPQSIGQPAKEKESQLPASEPEAPKPQTENWVSQDSRRTLPENKIPSLLKLTSDVRNEESPVWIHPKTGKEMRCGFNQTSQHWEKKPLAEILRASSTNPSWESGNGSALTRSFSQRIHIPYNPEDPEWIGYPNPFEY